MLQSKAQKLHFRFAIQVLGTHEFLGKRLINSVCSSNARMKWHNVALNPTRCAAYVFRGSRSRRSTLLSRSPDSLPGMFRPMSNHVQDTHCFGWLPVEFQEVTGENFLHDVKCSREFLQKLIIRFRFSAHTFIIHVGDVTHLVGWMTPQVECRRSCTPCDTVAQPLGSMQKLTANFRSSGHI